MDSKGTQEKSNERVKHKFAKRSDTLPGIGIIFDALDPFPIEESKLITLHSEVGPHDYHSVLIKNTLRNTDGTFTGKVFAFEPPVMEVRGLKEGDTVTFTEDEVFGAIKNLNIHD